jgi:peptidoglycan/xylan/chitin deacetylase (PgdA/CDA1 family)
MFPEGENPMVENTDSFPVMITIDVDGETLWLNRDRENANRPVLMSQGAFGPRVAVPRLLETFAARGVRATFFVPGWIAENYPALVRRMVDEGHEVAHHGYLHEWPTGLSLDDEIAAIDRGIAAIEAACGVRPIGYRAPGWELTEHTLGLVAERGFVYSSNLMDADEPYVLPTSHGDLVEVPVEWAMSDSSHYLYSMRLPGTRIAANEPVRDIWLGTLEAHARAGIPALLTLHPELSGRLYRLALVEEFIDRAESLGGRFLSCSDVAAAVA